MHAAHLDLADTETRLDADTEIELLARAEHLRLLFRHGPIVLLANLSAGIALTIGLWPAVSHPLLVGWIAALLILNGARVILARHLARVPIATDAVPRQEAALLAGTLGSGLLWGAAAIWLYVPNQPAFSLFLALILVAMTAASTVLLSFHRIAFPVFCTPIILPLVIQLIGDSGATQTTIALVMPIYYSLLFVLSHQIYRYSHDAIVNGSIRERHALLDQVTAIPNRRAFEEFFHEEWLRATRTHQPLSLILCDIDHFKRYNDEFGHAVGDEVLRAVAALCREAARRKHDFAARIGGDEFAIVAVDTGREGADAIVGNLRRSRDEMAVDTFEDWSFPTVSIGVCTTTPSPTDSAFDVFEQADGALYRAKAAMRVGERRAVS